MARVWKDTKMLALAWTQSDGSAAAGIPDSASPHPRSSPQVTSDFTVSGPGGPRKLYPPPGVFPDCYQPEHLTATGSPYPAWYPEGNMPEHLTRFAMLFLPSPARSAWSPLLPALPFAEWHRLPSGNRSGDVACLFSKSLGTMPPTNPDP